MELLATVMSATQHGPWGPGPWWPIFPILWVALWAAVIFAVFRFGRGWTRRHPAASGEGVLAERYARGEISEDEYRKRLTVLKQTTPR